MFVHVEDVFDPEAGYQVNELLKFSNLLNMEVTLITSNYMGPLEKKPDPEKDKKFEETYGIKIIRLPVKTKMSGRIVMKRMWKTIDALKPKVVYLHGIADFKDLVLYRKKKKYLILRDCHMSWVASKNKLAKLFYKFFKWFFAGKINKTNKYLTVFALGEEEKEYLQKIGIAEDKITMLPHGYNETSMFYSSESRSQTREKFGFQDEDVVITYTGKFNDSKRPDLIFDIVSRLPQEFIDEHQIRLLFVGSKNPEYFKFFQKKKAELLVNVLVVVSDFVPFENLRYIYSGSDICIFPKETTLSSIHAQVCGCPVIMENHKSNQERVVDNNHLYNTDDFDGAAKIIKDIIYNKEYIKSDKYLKKLENREYKNQIKLIKQVITAGDDSINIVK